MKTYKEFSAGWLIFITLIPIQLIIAQMYFFKVGDVTLDKNGFVIANILFLAIYLLLYGMTTKVAEEKITVSFGIGLIRKAIDLKRIESVETVKTKWYHGWGIRIIMNGVLYNISGTDAVELKFKDSHRIVRIGSKNSGNLKQEIDNRL
ncbi:MAG: hypothetical protein H6600_05355 [Flavobacteriales bacterium]|nr:hypothetical protein [Flavobacteriales bacterium]